MMSACPPPERLLRLDDAEADDAGYRALEAHIGQCPDCQEALERLARQDPDEDRAEPDDRPASWPSIPGYAIVRELGRGGSGVVYEATRAPIGRRVALKVLDDRPGLGASARRRWIREAKALGAVRHPSIVRLYDAGEHEGRSFLVLDLIEGGSVQDRLERRPAPRIAAELIGRVARAVAELHRRGIRHLDIKPSNILLDDPGDEGWLSPMLADFGIAGLDDDAPTGSLMTGTKGPWGTPAYMAPEQVSGRRAAIGPSADIFALGSTLYAMLTGEPPFRATTVLETLDRLRHREPTKPSDLAPGIPRDLETICLTCLQKEPDARYASAEALADDLDRWLHGRPILARRASWFEVAWRWSRRHPLPASLLGMLVVTLFAGLTALAALWKHAESERQVAQEALDRARAGESAAGEAIENLTTLLRESAESPELFASERSRNLVPGVLALTGTVRDSSAILAKHAGTIAALELDLAGLVDRQTNFEAMRALLDDGIRLLDTVPPRSVKDERTLAALRLYRALLARREGREAEAIADAEEAIEILAPRAGEPDWLELVVNLDGLIQDITDGATGGDSPAGRLASLYENRVHPQNFPPRWVSRAAWCRTRMDAVEEMLGQIARFDRILPSWRFALADGIAAELVDRAEREQAFGLDDHALGERTRLDLEAWDRRLDRSDLSEAVLERVGQQGMTRAITRRRAGQWDELRHSIRWMKGLGAALVAADPDRPGVHLLLSRAFDEEGKMAEALGDRGTAEAAWRRSLREATLAYERSPEDPENRRNLAEIRERLLHSVVNNPDPRP